MTSKTKRATAIKPRKPVKMWQDALGSVCTYEEAKEDTGYRSVMVFDLSEPSVAAIREKVARAICEADGLVWAAQASPFTSGSGGNDQDVYMHQADFALAALGLTAKRKGSK